MISLYNPKSIKVSDAENDEDVNLYIKKIKESIIDYCPLFITKHSFDEENKKFLYWTQYMPAMGAAFSLQEAVRLKKRYEEENDFKYDIVLKIRQDLFYDEHDDEFKKTFFNHIDLCDCCVLENKMYSHWVDTGNEKTYKEDSDDTPSIKRWKNYAKQGVIGDMVLMSSSINFDKSFYNLIDFLVKNRRLGTMGSWTEHQLFKAVTTNNIECKRIAFPAFFIYREYHNDCKDKSFESLFLQADVSYQGPKIFAKDYPIN